MFFVRAGKKISSRTSTFPGYRAHTHNIYTRTILALESVQSVLGPFLSGSTTISNLTFGLMQSVAAANIGERTHITHAHIPL